MSQYTGNIATERPRAKLTLLCNAQFVNVLSVTVVIVAMPSIQRDLSFSDQDLHWVVSVYALFFGGFLMLAGRAADVYGRRRLFMMGMVVFTLGAVACAFATSAGALIAARAIQGTGAAIALPAALAVVTTTFTEAGARRRALGVWTATAAGGGAAGFFLGGLLTGSLGWQWVFGLSVPIGVVTLALSRVLLPPDPRGSSKRSLDLAGALTVTAGLAAVIFASSRAQHEGFDVSTWAMLLVGLSLLVSFALIERGAEDPLIPSDAFRSGALIGANVVAFSVTAVTSPASVIGTLYLQNVMGYTAAAVGVAFAPFSLAVIVGSIAGSWLMGRVGARRTIAGGLLVVAAAMLCASGISVEGGVAYLVAGIVVSGFGLGCASVPSTAVGTTTVQGEEQGVASGLLNTAAQVGTALGIGLLVSFAVARASAAAGGGDPSPAQLVEGYRAALWAAGALSVAALVAAMALIRAPADGSAGL
jgi:EmrB/QacA subfamily drug resistance transporter